MSESSKVGASRRASRKILKAEYGELPYRCYFCQKLIYLDYGSGASCLHVHHIDGNPFNTDINNLAAAHGGCHHEFHGSTRGKRIMMGLDPDENVKD